MFNYLNKNMFNYLKKKLTLLSISLMVLVMTVSNAFAAETVMSKDYSLNDLFTAKVNITVDRMIVKPGDTFTLDINAENVSNADKTTLEKFTWNFMSTIETEAYTSILESPVPSYDSNLSCNQKSTKLILTNDDDSYKISDFKASLKFTVKETAQPIEFELTNSININNSSSSNLVEFNTIKMQVSNDITPEPTEATYTISAKLSADSVYVGDTFSVDVVASTDKAADLAAADAVLQYDKDLVKPIKAEAKTLTKGEALFYTDGKNGVENDGQGRLTTWGDTASVGTDGLVIATYTFEALKEGNAQFSIADGAKIGKSGETAEFTAASGAAASVEIKKIPDEKVLISNSAYKGAPDGKQVLKYITQSMPAEGSAYFYGDDAQPLYYAGNDSNGKHVFQGFVDASLTLDTLASVSEKTGSYETLSVDGDLNGSSSVNAVDSLIAYDLASGVYSSDADMSKLDAKARLEADINRDGKVDAADARAIMYKALRINDTSAL